MTLVIIGGVATDILVTADALPTIDTCRRASAFSEGAGGKAANQSVAASRLGAGAVLIGAIGDDDRGRSILSALEGEAVDVTLVRRIERADTGAFVLVRDELGKTQATVFPGANALLTPQHIEAVAGALRAASAVLVQLEVPFETVLRAAQIALAAGVPVFLDPSPARTLPDELLRAVRAIKPNAREARALTGIDVRDRATARMAAMALLGRGVALAAVEAGDEGNLFLTHDEEIYVPKFAVRSVGRIGAGDALTAALAVALAESMPLAQAARFASAAAALTTRALSAQAAMPTRAEVNDLLRDDV